MPGRRGGRRAGAVVADPQVQAVLGVMQFDVNSGARSVAARIGECLLDDAIGGQLNTWVQRGRQAMKDQPGPGPGRLAGIVEQVVQLGQAGLWLPLGGTPGVLAQHAEQPPHLGEPGTRGVPDRGQFLRTGSRKPGRGQSSGLGLHGDHRDVVRDHVMQLPRDARSFPARGVVEQGGGDGLPSGVALGSVAMCPVGDAGPRGRRRKGGKQDGEDARLGCRGPWAGECEHQERCR